MKNVKQLLERLNNLRLDLVNLPFTNDIVSLGGNIYAVGGIVRDTILDKESKDLDIIITGVEIPTLIKVLNKSGKVDIVGESFGIIKYKEFGSKTDIDIALPRKEVSTGEKGHKAFDVTSDPFLAIEDDLIRRDITINSMALSMDGTLIDPFHGFEDIASGKIAHTNNSTFFEDPLRMLRAVQFAARFKFEIDAQTLSFIKNFAKRIHEIPSERIVIELEKIVTKGDPQIGVSLLFETGLFEEIFESKHRGIEFTSRYDELKNVRTLGELIYQLCHLRRYPHNETPSEFWISKLKGDLNTFKEIKALEEMSKYQWMSGQHLMLKHMFNAFKISPVVIDSKMWSDSHFRRCILAFKNGKYPKSLKDLPIVGEDLISLGLKGAEIGQMFDIIVSSILNNTVNLDDKEGILSLVKEKITI